MEKLCFILNDKKLYLETNLVYFNEIPIFFVCSDLKDCYYLVFNIDINNLESYLEAKTFNLPLSLYVLSVYNT